MRHSGDVHTATVVLRSRVVVIDLDLHTALRGELRDDDLIRDLLKDCGISLAAEAVVEGVQVRSSDDVLQVDGLATES